MSGTKTGGLKASVTNKSRHGEDFYRRIGKLGGKVPSRGGFAYLAEHDPEKLKMLSAQGGSKSRRGISGQGAKT